MKINKLILPCLFVGMVIQSCSDQQEITNSNEQGISKSQVLFTIDDFIEDTNTRTNCDPENNYQITWAEGDVIGVFPREGYQEPFEIPAEQIGLESATFDGGYWALKKGKTYNAYYPFSLENFKSAECKTQIPVTYLGQYQNGTDCCVGAYDYTYSDWVTYEDGAAVNFAFHHIGSFLVLSLNIPATTTYTSLTLNAEHEVIPTTGTYDLTAAKPAFVAKTYASSLTMQLNDFEGVAGETSVFYMMIPPMDLSAENMTVTLSTGTASCTYSIESMNIAPRKLVRKTGEPVSSDIPGTITGWNPEDRFNGHEYVDLGLPSGLLWATCNVGATNPEDYGDYFTWGDTETYYTEGHSQDSPCKNWKPGIDLTITAYDWTNYKWSDTPTGGTKASLTKYNSNSSYGRVDNKKVLDLEDDAARQNWGGSWRMPTLEEIRELINNCTYERCTLNNVNGMKVTGPNGNCIFLPAAGWRTGVTFTDLYNNAPLCNYWTSTGGGENATALNNLNNINGVNYANKLNQGSASRCNGLTIRPVSE